MNRQNVARVIMFEIKKDQKIRKKELSSSHVVTKD